MTTDTELEKILEETSTEYLEEPVEMLGEETRKTRRGERLKKVRNVSIAAATLLGFGIAAEVGHELGYNEGYDQGEDDFKPPESLVQKNILIKSVENGKILYNEDLNPYEIPLDNETISKIIEGHDSLEKWFNYLSSNGGVDYNNSSIIVDKYGNLELTLYENETENKKSDIIPYAEVLEKVPQIENVDEVNFISIGYKETNSTVERYINDQELIGIAKGIVENATSEDLDDYTSMRLLDTYNPNGTVETRIQFIGEDNKTVGIKENVFEDILAYIEDNNPDKSYKPLRDQWKQTMDAYFDAIEQWKYTPSGLLIISPEDIPSAFDYLDSHGYWSTNLNETEINDLNMTFFNPLLQGWTNQSSVVVYDTPDDTKYVGMAFRIDGDVMYPVRIPLYREDLEAIKG